MATDTIRFAYYSGFAATLTADVFPAAGGAAHSTGRTLTVDASDAAAYTFTVVTPVAGTRYKINLKDSGGTVVTFFYVTLRNDAGTYTPDDDSNVRQWKDVVPNALISGRVDVTVGAMQANTITTAACADAFLTTAKLGASFFDGVWSVGTRVLTAGTNIVLAKDVGVTGFTDLTAAQVNAEADTALADAGVTTVAMAHLDADVSSRAAAATALSTATWTSARAGYLDNINVGQVASQQDVLNVANNTRVRAVFPGVLERPDAGTDSVPMVIELYDSVGNMEAPDSTPTIELLSESGSDLSSRVSAVANPSTGRYTFTYANAVGDTLEVLRWKVTVVEGGATRTYSYLTQLVDTSHADFTSSDRTVLNAIKAVSDLLPNAGALTSLATSADMTTALANLSTLLGRLTSARGGYLDNLSAGAVALEATLTAIKGSGWTTETLKLLNDTLAIINAKLPTALTTDGLMKADSLRHGGTLQTAGDIVSLLGTIASYIDTEVAAIKTKTDLLPGDPASAATVASQIAAVQTAVLAKLPAALVSGRIDSSVGDVVAAALAVFFTRDTTKVFADAVVGSVVKEVATGATASGGATMATAVPASPTAGTMGDALASELHWNKGKKEYINNGDGTYTFRVYKYNDTTTVWRSWTANHPTDPSTLVPV